MHYYAYCEPIFKMNSLENNYKYFVTNINFFICLFIYLFIYSF